ncbi:MAG: RIP metalloprotease RseP [Alphaproteobacteria bacterium]|nr:RIP metalloprotease RseP [Alphaproteobacteria bacterium]
MGIYSIVISAVAFLGVFSVLVFFHELGHFWVARRFGIRVDIFSIGFGPPIWSRIDRNGIEWRVSAVPLGGFVKFFGDATGASNQSAALDQMSEEDRRDCFHFRPVHQRAAVVAAGPIANFVLAFVLFAGLFMTVGQSFTAPVIDGVVKDSPAATAGFHTQDRILSVGGIDVQSFEEVRNIVAMNPGKTLSVAVRRDGRVSTLRVTPTTVTHGSMKYGQMGIESHHREVVRRGPLESFYYSGKEIRDNVVLIVRVVAEMVQGERSVKDLGGPLKIAEVSGQVAQVSLIGLVMMGAALSVNLGLINLFPIPMLDGGHLLYYACEAVRGRPLGEKVQEYGFRLGMALVLLLMVVVTWNDLIGIVSRV